MLSISIIYKLKIRKVYSRVEDFLPALPNDKTILELNKTTLKSLGLGGPEHLVTFYHKKLNYPIISLKY